MDQADQADLPRPPSPQTQGAQQQQQDAQPSSLPPNKRFRSSASTMQALPFHGTHLKAVSAVKISPVAPSSTQSPYPTVASASADKLVKIWRPHATDTPACTTLTGHTAGINDVTWSTDGRFLCSASDDKTLRLWDVHTAQSLVAFGNKTKGHSNFVFCAAFNPASNLVVSGSFDEHVKLWDVRTGSCVSTLPAHSDPVTGVDFNRDGTCIVSGSHDGLVRIWDTATSECLKTIYAEGNPPVSAVKFSPNGKYVLAGTLDSALRLWNIASDGKCSKTYTGHTNVRFCCFAAFNVANKENETIVAGSEDGIVRLYGMQDKQVKQELEGHKGAVLAVDAGKHTEFIATGGMVEDKTVRFWAPGVL